MATLRKDNAITRAAAARRRQRVAPTAGGGGEEGEEEEPAAFREEVVTTADGGNTIIPRPSDHGVRQNVAGALCITVSYVGHELFELNGPR